jgi:tetratricopeptide (TPR) repeat protein
MIGRLRIDEPDWPDFVPAAVEEHRERTGQDCLAILHFGLWGLPRDVPQMRLYAGYRYVREHPEEGPAWLELARVHREAGEGEVALAILDELARLGSPGLYPGVYREDVRAHAAHVWAEAGLPARALETLEALEPEHAGLPIYHYVRGAILHALLRFDEARTQYGLALVGLETMAADPDAFEEVDLPEAAAAVRRQERRARERLPFDGVLPMGLGTLAAEGAR